MGYNVWSRDTEIEVPSNKKVFEDDHVIKKVERRMYGKDNLVILGVVGLQLYWLFFLRSCQVGLHLASHVRNGFFFSFFSFAL